MTRSRILKTTVLGLVVAAVAVPVAQAHPWIEVGTSTSPQIHALALRSQGMNQLYGKSQAIRALTLRSEALNKANGLGTYQGTAALRVRSVALNEHYGVGTSIASSGSSFDWNQGIAGAAGVFAMVLVLAAAIVITRRRGGTPLGA